MNDDDPYLVRIAFTEMIYKQECPHVLMKPKIYLDGNKWCALYGDTIQEGVCGFGDTPAEAANNFDLQWWRGLDKNGY